MTFIIFCYRPESKIHNDASVDVSADGRFLVTLVPCTSLTGALISKKTKK